MAMAAAIPLAPAAEEAGGGLFLGETAAQVFKTLLGQALHPGRQQQNDGGPAENHAGLDLVGGDLLVHILPGNPGGPHHHQHQGQDLGHPQNSFRLDAVPGLDEKQEIHRQAEP